VIMIMMVIMIAVIFSHKFDTFTFDFQ
jgi:hypothetical protein